jgi:hypothetical protein
VVGQNISGIGGAGLERCVFSPGICIAPEGIARGKSSCQQLVDIGSGGIDNFSIVKTFILIGKIV